MMQLNNVILSGAKNCEVIFGGAKNLEFQEYRNPRFFASLRMTLKKYYYAKNNTTFMVR